MGVCLIHRAGSLFEATLEVTATPGSVVTATSVSETNKKIYSGTAATNGKITFILKKKDSYTVTSNAAGTRTATVAATLNKGSYTANITGEFSITSITKTNASLTVTRSKSPYAGASVGSAALAVNSKIYYGDVLSLSGSANTGFGSYTIKVGSTAITNGMHTVTGNCAITASATATAYSFTASINGYYQVKVKRTVGTVGKTAGATNSDSITSGTKIYYGDTLTFTPVPNPANYGSYTVKHGSSTAHNAVKVAKSLTVSNNVVLSSALNPNKMLYFYYSWSGKNGGSSSEEFRFSFPGGATLKQIADNSTWRVSTWEKFYSKSSNDDVYNSCGHATLSLGGSTNIGYSFTITGRTGSVSRSFWISNAYNNQNVDVSGTTVDTSLTVDRSWYIYKDAGT